MPLPTVSLALLAISDALDSQLLDRFARKRSSACPDHAGSQPPAT